MVLYTKLSPPKARANLVKRTRLLSLVKKGMDRKVIFITAGAGYGKTTLLIQLLKEFKKRYIWYEIEYSDRDINIFLKYIITGIKRFYPDFGSRTENLLKTEHNSCKKIEMVIGTFINEIEESISEELYFILEDYHCIDKAKCINDAMKYLIDHQPYNLHIILTSRKKLPFSISNLLSKDELIEINTDSLRFNTEDIESLSDVLNIEISDNEVVELEEKTEGWITALKLFLSDRKPSKNVLLTKENVTTASNLFDYFEVQLFSSLSKDIKDFLILSSLVHPLTPSLCNRILQREDSTKVLESLYRNNLFISKYKDNSGKIYYKYHMLFREFLKEKAVELYNKSDLNDLYIHAGRIMEQLGDYRNAISHRLKAKDFKTVVKLIERTGEKIIEGGEINTLKNWIELIPENFIKESIRLNLFKAKLLSIEGDMKEAVEIYQKVATSSKAKSRDRAEALVNIGEIEKNQGNWGCAISTLKEAIELLKKGNSLLLAEAYYSIGGCYFYSGNFMEAERHFGLSLKVSKLLEDENHIASALYGHGVLYMNFGRFFDAIWYFKKALNKEVITNLNTVSIYNALGSLYTIIDEYEEAEKYLNLAMIESNRINSKVAIMTSLCNLGGLYVQKDNLEKALFLFSEASSLNDKVKDIAIDWIIYRGLSDIAFAKGDFPSALEYIEKDLEIAYRRKNRKAIADYSIQKGMIYIYMERFIEAEKILKDAIQTLEKIGVKLDLMSGYHFLSLLYFRCEKGDEFVKEYIEKTIEIAKENNYGPILKRIYTRNEPEICNYCIEHNIEREYIMNIMKEGSKESNKRYDFKVFLFGDLTIIDPLKKTKIIKKWRTKKTKSLFCYFISNRDKSFVRDRLMEIFWPRKLPKFAKRSLHTEISYINKKFSKKSGFDKIILYANECYYVNPEYKLWVDVEQFDALLRKARDHKSRGEIKEAIILLKEAEELYTGSFLINIYDRWCEDKKQFFSINYIKALSELSKHYFDLGEYFAALEYNQKIIKEDPFIEDPYINNMRCYIELHNKKAAKKEYHKLQDFLRKELGEEPSLKTQEIYKSLIR